ncbi:MAG: transposase, partial [Candidatus Dadabacteria bacterium]|nr:transposase [Candidatus Dadabacteria bacterium]
MTSQVDIKQVLTLSTQPPKHYTPKQIIRHLRQAEVISSEGRNLPEICREIGVTVNTYDRWRKEY